MTVAEQETYDVLEDAREMVSRCGQTCRRVIRVEGDCILYLNALGKARTLWLHTPADGPARYHWDAGFVAEPPAGWHEQRPGDEYGTVSEG